MTQQISATVIRKRCRKCGVYKGRSGFTVHPKMKDGLHSWCRSCNRSVRRVQRVAQSSRKVKVAVLIEKLMRRPPDHMPPPVGKLTVPQYKLVIYLESLGFLAPHVDALAWRFGADGLGRLTDKACARVDDWVRKQM